MRTAVEVERRPVSHLLPYVTSYSGFELRGFPAGVHLGAPGRALNVLIGLSTTFDVASRAGEVPGVRRFDTVAGGLTSRSVAIRHDGTQHGVRLALTPAGARAIFGVPAGALADELVPLDDLLGTAGAELVERLRLGPTWASRFDALDRLLARIVARRGAAVTGRARPEVAEAWRRLLSTAGRLHLGSLAAELGWSRRHLGAQFRREIGLTPKTVARILRFERAYHLAATDGPVRWADVSATAGYADQAHLVREWREFTGRSPTAWRRGEVLLTR